MTRIAAAVLAFALSGVTAFDVAGLSAQAGQWVSLFDGKTLNGWNTVGTADWKVVDGAMQAITGNGYLITPQSYGDFQLTVEFWADPDANSGVFLRCSNPKMISGMTAYEVQIFDTRPDPTYATGSLTFIAEPAVQTKVANKWNTFEITAEGSRIAAMLNGIRMFDVRDLTYTRGPIALQRTGGVIKFRSVRVRTL